MTKKTSIIITLFFNIGIIATNYSQMSIETQYDPKDVILFNPPCTQEKELQQKTHIFYNELFKGQSNLAILKILIEDLIFTEYIINKYNDQMFLIIYKYIIDQLKKRYNLRIKAHSNLLHQLQNITIQNTNLFPNTNITINTLSKFFNTCNNQQIEYIISKLNKNKNNQQIEYLKLNQNQYENNQQIEYIISKLIKLNQHQYEKINQMNTMERFHLLKDICTPRLEKNIQKIQNQNEINARNLKNANNEDAISLWYTECRLTEQHKTFPNTQYIPSPEHVFLQNANKKMRKTYPYTEMQTHSSKSQFIPLKPIKISLNKETLTQTLKILENKQVKQ